MWDDGGTYCLSSIILEFSFIGFPPFPPLSPSPPSPPSLSPHTRKSQRSMLVTSVLCLGLSVRPVTRSSVMVLLATPW